jgi:hypothetical protein
MTEYSRHQRPFRAKRTKIASSATQGLEKKQIQEQNPDINLQGITAKPDQKSSF